MADVIKLLPEHVANQIAAGEVIQRPASVVKELLENAVDAGSKSIILHIKDGGRTLIQVIDDGAGMSETDARMSWERHATSKIASADDLFKLNTKGFRGEALASIAAIAHTEMRTRRHTDEVATQIMIEGSEVKSVEAVNANAGTSITVKNLFYNVPARRQFLKSNPVETKYIIDEFLRVALPHPDIAFEFYNNGNDVFKLKSGTMEQRILEVFADKKQDEILYVEETTSVASIKGFVGVPQIAKKTRGEQYLFVNNRFFRDGYLNHAISSAYKELIPKDVFPFYIFFFSVRPESIDVNVHPQKTEIKFEDERIIYQFLHAVARKALGDHIQVPEADFNMAAFTVKPGVYATQPRIDLNTGFNPFVGSGSGQTQACKANSDWQKIFDGDGKGSFSERFEAEQTNLKAEFVGDIKPDTLIKKESPSIDSIWQVNKKYIMAQTGEELYIIEQEKAHERILYEKYLRSINGQQIATQERLFPQLVDLQPTDFVIVHDLLPHLALMGFDLAVFGKNSLIINGVPAGIKNANEKLLIEGMVDDFKQTQTQAKGDWFDILARSIARKTGVKQGDELSQTEITNLFEELFQCENPYFDISGKRTLKILSSSDLEKLFI